MEEVDIIEILNLEKPKRERRLENECKLIKL